MHWRLTIVLTVLFLLPETDSRGQATLNFPLLGRGAYSHHFANVFSGIHNQASLAGLSSFSAGVFLQQRFSLRELRTGYFAAALPLSSGTFSLQGTVGGYSHFHRQRLALAFAKKLFDWLDAGVALNYLNMQVPSYGGAHAFTFTVSALSQIGKQWSIGLQVFNPAKVKYQKLGDDAIPIICRLGVGYQPSKIVLLTTELLYVHKKMDVSLAFQYRIARVLSLRAGAGTGMNPVFAGIELHLKKLKILISAAWHQQLGLSPGAGFIFINQPANDM